MGGGNRSTEKEKEFDSKYEERALREVFVFQVVLVSTFELPPEINGDTAGLLMNL